MGLNLVSLPRLDQLGFSCSFDNGLFALSDLPNAVGFGVLSVGL